MKKQNWFLKNIGRILTSTLFVVAAIVLLRTFIVDWSVVPSGSMTKTFLTGDVVINNKMAYGHYDWCSIPILGVHLTKKKLVNLPKVKRGDIIVFCGKKDYITKRVVGLPGDIITWDNMDLIINGESTMFNADGTYIYPTDETFVLTKNHHDRNKDEVMDVHHSRIPVENGKYLKITTVHSRDYLPHEKITYKVPEGRVFIVGDNRYPVYSWDSRSRDFGDVDMSTIVGKIWGRLVGSNAKIFNRARSLLANIIMLPYQILRYILALDFTRFGRVNTEYEIVSKK